MNMSRLLAAGLGLFTAASVMASEARASTFSFVFSGPGIAGSLVLTYGAATDAKYAGAYEITGISGVFSDANNGLGIVNAPVSALVPITRSTPDSTNLLAPKDFSRFAVASGLSPISGGYATYDNLFWPGGSPQTATDYPPHGGFLDIYGLLFEIGGGRVVNFWSNGVGEDGSVDYGASVVSSSMAFDYVEGGVTAAEVVTPEPGAFLLVGAGLVGVFTWRRRTAATTA